MLSTVNMLSLMFSLTSRDRQLIPLILNDQIIRKKLLLKKLSATVLEVTFDSKNRKIKIEFKLNLLKFGQNCSLPKSSLNDNNYR